MKRQESRTRWNQGYGWTGLTTLALMLLAIVLFGGCEENPVQEYGNQVLKGYERSEQAASQASLSNLQRAVEAYRAANGGYPPSLQELEAFSGLAIDPAAFRYDPLTGRIEAAAP